MVAKEEAWGPAFSQINVTPLVDVMLVLLIVFMITAPMMGWFFRPEFLLGWERSL